METLKRLFEIWHSDYMDALPSAIKDRGYSFADNVKRDILITGFNPSFRDGDRQGIIHGPAANLWKDEKWDNYVGPIKKMIVDDSVDLREKTDYLDIFYFRSYALLRVNQSGNSAKFSASHILDMLESVAHPYPAFFLI